jgi:hypothetical protein
MDEALSHEHSKGKEMQAFKGVRQTFIVTSQASETGHPAKTALDDPTLGQ